LTKFESTNWNSTVSAVRGPVSPALIDETVGRCFDDAADRWAGRDAIIVCHQSIRWTYGALRKQVDNAALGFLALGLQPGERVGLWAPNSAEWAMIQYAVAKAGLVLVGINPTLRVKELAYVINKVECAALVFAASVQATNVPAIIQELVPAASACDAGRLSVQPVPSLRLIIGIGTTDEPAIIGFDKVLAEGARQGVSRLQAVASRIRSRDAVSIQFTSGTTGPPKAATLSHYNLVNAAFFGAERLRITEVDRICVPVPLFHSFGMVGGNLLALTHGAAVVYPSATFDPGATLAAIEAERCTALYGVPAMFAVELRHRDFARFDLDSLRTGIVAGAPCPETLRRRVIDEMHMPELVTAFGMTETSAAGLSTMRDDPIERRAATVGRVTAHTEIKIVDQVGAVVPRGVAGEFCVRGFSVMLGYWNDPQATTEVIDAEGWMHTGDLVAIDKEGYGTVLGRVRDLVNSGGEKILPSEVEAFLLHHPAIEAAQVFGIAHPTRGEELCAWINLKPGYQLTAAEVKSFCRGEIATFKIPRHIRFVDAFPMTATGKIQKFVMRQRMSDEQ
jgi:fatty-acyl-CoA synthase